MKPLFWRFSPEVVLGFVLVTAGCDPSNNVPPGPPQLVSTHAGRRFSSRSTRIFGAARRAHAESVASQRSTIGPSSPACARSARL